MSGDPLLELAATGLRHTDTVCLDTATVRAIAGHRITGAAMSALRAGAIEGDPDVIELLREGHRQAVESSMAAMAAGGRAVDLLTAAGLQPVVLKGWATAHLDHADPCDRNFGDADLLLGAHIVDALDVLVAAGGVVDVPPPSRAWLARFGKDVAVRLAGYEVDLHRSLVEGAFGLTIDIDELAAHTEPFTVGRRQLLALDAPGRLVHAAVHTASSTIERLSSARDVATLLVVTAVPWEIAVERAARWRVDGLLAAGIATTWRQLGMPAHPAADWAAAHAPDPAQRRALASLRTGESRWWSGVTALPWRVRPAYLAPMAWPSAEYLAARGRTRREHITLSLGRLRP